MKLDDLAESYAIYRTEALAEAYRAGFNAGIADAPRGPRAGARFGLDREIYLMGLDDGMHYRAGVNSGERKEAPPCNPSRPAELAGYAHAVACDLANGS